MSDDPNAAFTDPQDTYAAVSTQSWFSRLGGALVASVFGLIMVPGSAVLLGWNENNAVMTARALQEGAGAVVDAPLDRVDPALQGRLVHVAGALSVPGTLADPEYGASAPGAARLTRHAEMFQWKQSESQETHNRLGGGTETVTTYRYAREWSATAQDSSRFRQPGGHSNPPFRVPSREFVAEQGSLGAYRLDRALLGRLGPAEKLPVTEAPRTGRLHDDGVYLGADPAAPNIGDIRIGYTTVRPSAASYVAAQAGNSFGPYLTSNGRTVLLADSGEVPATAMFGEAQHENAVLTWVLRAVGTLVMLIGFILLLSPFPVLASVIPLLGDVVAGGTFFVGLLATAVLAPLVIGLAWLAVRPILGGSVLVAGALMVVGIVSLIRRRRRARTPWMPPPRPA